MKAGMLMRAAMALTLAMGSSGPNAAPAESSTRPGRRRGGRKAAEMWEDAQAKCKRARGRGIRSQALATLRIEKAAIPVGTTCPWCVSLASGTSRATLGPHPKG